jgi:hypothetical protein
MPQAEEIVELCDNAEKLFKQEKSVLELRVRSLHQMMTQQRNEELQQQGQSSSSDTACISPPPISSWSCWLQC